ncbi:AraC family transcriptional regulator [Hymenobacter defluvii]|uniref:Helix-turn-helix domain-containing protein n=1 Tax=Hymenobacter defluvii TaxID=2054411 RepID=A0ABS3T9B5_9BACT|nr:helix-turn-helix transcriptional regulator [Hymenobacter defluvii]MBO3270246.1 helix-turn-helix domain-containing protein [Hymenobacter defluvii]
MYAPIISYPSIPSYPLEVPDATGGSSFQLRKMERIAVHGKNDLLIPHRKDYYFMVLLWEGSGRHWVDTTAYTLKPDTLYFTVPHQVHLKEVLQPVSGFNLNFTEEFLALDSSGVLRQLPIIQNPQNGHELHLAPSDVAFVQDILEKAYVEYSAAQPWHRTVLLAYLHVLLVYLSRLYTEQYCTSEKADEAALLSKFRTKIDASYSRHHDVATYADMLHLSAGHLSEVVKAQSGKSAIAHIHERLVVEAKRLLFHTEYTSKEIAFQLGFEDASYFNRFFKRLTQQTPLHYRLATREMYQ